MSKIIEGNLPLIVENQNTEKIKNYQIYGTASGAGVETENLFNINAKDANNGYEYRKYLNSSGNSTSFGPMDVSEFIEVKPSTTYTLKYGGTYSAPSFCIYDSQKNFVRGETYSNRTRITFTTSENEKYIRMSYYTGSGTRFLIEGSTAPTTYIPYGYKLPMTVTSEEETENLFNINRERSDVFTLDSKYYIYGGRADNKSTTTTGVSIIVTDEIKVQSNGGPGAGFIVPVLPDTTYTLSYEIDVSVATDRSSAALNVINSEGELGTFWAIYGNENKSTFTTGNDTEYVYIVFRVINKNATFSNIMLTEGSTPPDHYIPYRYSTTTPIYIGDTKLGAEEYVDYEEQKVYKRTVNIWNADMDYTTDKYLTSLGTLAGGGGNYSVSDYIHLAAETEYTISPITTVANANAYHAFYDTNQNLIETLQIGRANESKSFTTPQGCAYARFTFRSATVGVDSIMLVEGNTLPETFVPYLQPTDPPVALPTIPLYKGTNTLSSTTELGKVILDYSVPEIFKVQLENQLYDLIDRNFYNMIADSYSSSLTYNEGDYCIYNYQLYKCISTISIPEDFDSEKWSQVTLAESLRGD